MPAASGRFAFELDPHPERALITGHAGVPVVLETWRASGAGAVLDQLLPKKRKGLPASHLVEAALALMNGATLEPAGDNQPHRFERTIQFTP